MNLAHLHLYFNHLPIFGSLFGAIVLAYGVRSKSGNTKMAAYVVLIISSLATVITYFTGASAEELVQNIPGVANNLIEQHEKCGLVAIIGFGTLGILSIVAVFLTLKDSLYVRGIAIIILSLSIICFALVTVAGYQGVQIRHTELKPSNSATIQIDNEKDGD